GATRARPLRAPRRGVPARASPPTLDGRSMRARGDDAAAGRRRPASRRHRVVPPERPAAEVRSRVDGGLARAALTVPRSKRRRARARAPARARVRQGGAQAGVRRRPAARRRNAPKKRLRRPPRPLVPRGATSGGRGPAPLPRARSFQARRPRAPAPGARGGGGRPRPPPVVPLHARALAAVPRRRPSPATRRCVTRTRAYAIVLAACVLPRAIV